MPIVSVGRDALFQRLEKKYSEEEFQNLCFDFGIELDDVTSEAEIVRRNQGDEAAKGLSEEILFKIDIPANRYDLLCLEGLSRALRIFLGRDDPPLYQVTHPAQDSMLTMTVAPETSQVRPFVVAAVLRDLKFTEESYQSFIDLQDKLHQNICRKRTLVAISTHDLDTIQGPFRYEARTPRDISFVPLKEEKEFDADSLFDYYRSKPQCPLKEYLPIIDSSPVFPVIYDSKDIVLSLPPIINGEHSKITLNTKNVFIECTATDLTKAHIVLQTVCCMFAEYCSSPFSVEAVKIVYEADGREMVTPDMNNKTFSTSVDYINKGIGVDLSREQMHSFLERMQLKPTSAVDASTSSPLVVDVPPTRSDVLHPCDILEDVAIAYGYNNVVQRIPGCYTIARQQPLNALSDQIRHNVAQAGFLEVLTWALVSRQENFENMLQEEVDQSYVSVGNPKTREFQMVRTSLLPGLLKTLSANRARVQLPARIFELSDVTLIDPSHEYGASNQRRLAALYSGNSSGFEQIHGLLDRVMQLVEVEFATEEDSLGKKSQYFLKTSENPSFFPKLQSDIWIRSPASPEPKRLGVFGILHPQVLAKFGIDTPCSALEINVQLLR